MTRVVVKDIHTPIMMARRRELPIPTQVDTQPKAPRARPARLIRLHQLPALEIPHVYSSIVRRAREVLFRAIQRDGPYVAAALALRLGGRDFEVERKLARGRVVAAPDLDVAAEADRRGDGAAAVVGGQRSRGDVVRAELVCGEGLREGEGAGGVGGAVDVDCGGAAAGEEGGRGGGEGEDLGGVGWSGVQKTSATRSRRAHLRSLMAESKEAYRCPPCGW